MSEEERPAPETERVHRQPLSQMGRRRFVKTLAAAGFSIATASHLSAGDFEGIDEEEVPIVYAVARDDPEEPGSLTPRTRTVTASWYNDIQAALSARDTLDLADVDGVLNVYVVPGDHDGGSASIAVDVRNEEAAAKVADLSEEVPIESSVVDVEAVGDRGTESGQPRQRFDPGGGPAVPGGVAVSDGESIATLGPALYTPQDEAPFFATADHLYTDGGEELSVVVDGQQRTLGRLHRRHEDVDIALIRPTDELEPSTALYGPEPNRVVGQFSRIGLADLKARGVEIHKTGAMTGHTTGEIQAIDGVTCVYGDPCKSGQLKWGRETDFADGDSGSVSYYPDPQAPHEQVFVCGLNNARTWWPGEDYIWGTGAYLLHEEFGYTF